MKEWISREISTTTKDIENGILMRETELIRCKDCVWRYQSQINDLHYCFVMNIEVSDDDFCSRAKRRIE